MQVNPKRMLFLDFDAKNLRSIFPNYIHLDLLINYNTLKTST